MHYLILAFIILFSTAAAQSDTLESKFKAMASIKTLKADYRQKRIFKELDFSMTSNGSFAQQRGKALIWRTEKPVKAVYLISTDRLCIWNEHSNKTTTIKSDKLPWLELIFKLHDSCTSGKINQLKEHFDLTAQDSRILHLRPKNKYFAMFFKDIKIRFNESYSAVEKVLFTEKNGDCSEIEFFNIQSNLHLPESTWDMP